MAKAERKQAVTETVGKVVEPGEVVLTLTGDEADVLYALVGTMRNSSPTSPIYKALQSANCDSTRYVLSKSDYDVPIMKKV